MPEMRIMVGPGLGLEKWLQPLVPAGTKITPGDTKIIWDSNNPTEVEATKELFNKLIAKGFMAFRAKGKDGEKGDRLLSWDPDAERLIMSPKVAGG